VASLGDRFAAEPNEARADAVLDRLVRARADRDKAQRELESARAEADAVRAALDGDALHGALRSLTETLTAGPSAEVAAFNRRLRDHFDGFVIDPEGGPPCRSGRCRYRPTSSSPRRQASRCRATSRPAPRTSTCP
jgi:hypothetical protein